MTIAYRVVHDREVAADKSGSDITTKGRLVLIEWREAARRLGLPELEEASDSELLTLRNLLPPDVAADAESESQRLGVSLDEMIVAFIRYVLGLKRPTES